MLMATAAMSMFFKQTTNPDDEENQSRSKRTNAYDHTGTEPTFPLGVLDKANK